MDEENKIGLFEPGTIVFFIMAFFADLTLLGLFGLLIPGVGLAIAAFVLMAHWGFGLIILFYFWGKTQGWLPKAILILFWMLPLPLMAGLILMVVASSKIGAIVIEQVTIQTVAALTAGGGEALEAGAIAAEGAEVTATAAESAGAVAEGAEAVGEVGGTVAEAGTEGAEAGAETAEGGAEAAEGGVDEMASPEEGNPMEGVEREELEQLPEEEFPEEPEEELESEEKPEEKEGDKAADKVQKVFDILNRTNQPQGKDTEDGEAGGEDEEGLAEAA